MASELMPDDSASNVSSGWKRRPKRRMERRTPAPVEEEDEEVDEAGGVESERERSRGRSHRQTVPLCSSSIRLYLSGFVLLAVMFAYPSQPLVFLGLDASLLLGLETAILSPSLHAHVTFSIQRSVRAYPILIARLLLVKLTSGLEKFCSFYQL